MYFHTLISYFSSLLFYFALFLLLVLNQGSLHRLKNLLEEPVNLDATNVKGSNVVKDGGGNVDAAVAAAGAEIDDTGGGLVAVALDGDPSRSERGFISKKKLPYSFGPWMSSTNRPQLAPLA